MKRKMLFAGVGLLVLLAALGGLWLQQAWAVGSEGEDESAADFQWTISLNEMSFTLEGQGPNDAITLQAGKTYEITFVNDGTVEHELKVGNGDLLQRANGTPDGYTNNFFEGLEAKVLISQGPEKDVKLEMDSLDEVELDPGMSATVTFTVPESYAGQGFEIGCFVPGHYEAGMKAPWNVE